MSNKLADKIVSINGLRPAERFVLYRLSDRARDDGTNSYPGELLLSKETGYDRRTVRYLLRCLEEMGVIEKVKRTINDTWEYRITLDHAIAHGVTRPEYEMCEKKVARPIGKKGESRVTREPVTQPLPPLPEIPTTPEPVFSAPEPEPEVEPVRVQAPPPELALVPLVVQPDARQRLADQQKQHARYQDMYEKEYANGQRQNVLLLSRQGIERTEKQMLYWAKQVEQETLKMMEEERKNNAETD